MDDMKIKCLSCILVFMILFGFTANTYAQNLNNDGAPYNGYNYNEYRIVATPNGYLPERAVSGIDCGAGRFKSPQDFFVDKNNNVYVLDSGNNRVVILDADLKLKKIIDKFASGSGEETLNNPTGIFVDDKGMIYIADRENGRVLVSDQDGRISEVIGKPKTDTLPESFVFKPKKVIKSSTGVTYVLAENVVNGALEYDEDGNFTGYFGSNPVEFSLNLFWKTVVNKFLNKKQRMQLSRNVPIEYSSLDIDEKGFIYTCTDASQKAFPTGQIKRLNHLGKNLMKNISYDPAGPEFVNSTTTITTNFVDIDVDKDGFLNALDSGRGKVYKYNQESSLLFVFGSNSGAGGAQLGTFKMPVAVESMEGKVLVLDAKKNNITVFAETEFAKKVFKAMKLYRDGLNTEALEPWREVLKANNNYELAYTGIGKALMNEGQFKEAMKYFKLGQEKEYYSDAFKEYRTQVLREHFSLIMFLLLALIILVYLLKNLRGLKKMILRIGRGV